VSDVRWGRRDTVAWLGLLLVGCGTRGPAGGAPPGTPPAGQSPGAGPSIKDALGTVMLPGVASRVVALEWTYAEDLLAVGLQPIGVADVAGYRKWVNVAPALAPEVAEVGTRQEPNLEAIARLKPDLIVGVKFRHEVIRDRLREIAPTLIFDPYPPPGGPDQYQEMETTFLAIGEAVGRREAGVAVLQQLQAGFSQAAARLKAAGHEGREFVLTQAYTANNAPQLRLFLDNAMVVQLMTRLGLRNAWKADFDIYGFSTVGVEALATVERASLFYAVQDDDNVFASQLKDHPVWRNLTFVKEGRTYPLGGNTWLFGGPLSAQLVAEKVVSLLA
jgi:ABC-type Fe3+-hydroxamate transport system substrate-binding protein